MTLGDYPEGVRKAGLHPPRGVRIRPRVPALSRHRRELGVGRSRCAGGVVIDDFDGDGYLDLFVSRWGLARPSCATSGTTATARSPSAPRGRAHGRSSAASTLVQADYDNDGDLDVLVLRGAWLASSARGDHPDSLLRNNGDGTFDGRHRARPGCRGFRPTAGRAPGATTTTTAARPVHRQRVGPRSTSRPCRALPQQRRRHVHRRRRGGRRRQRAVRQGRRLGRLRRRRLARPLRLEPRPDRTASSTTTATARSTGRRGRAGFATSGRRAELPRASRPGSGTTTTTAGSTSSWPAVPGSDRPERRRGRRRLPRPAEQRASTLRLYRNDGDGTLPRT